MEEITETDYKIATMILQGMITDINQIKFLLR
jgi:hypothetical protein